MFLGDLAYVNLKFNTIAKKEQDKIALYFNNHSFISNSR